MSKIDPTEGAWAGYYGTFDMGLANNREDEPEPDHRRQHVAVAIIAVVVLVVAIMVVLGGLS